MEQKSWLINKENGVYYLTPPSSEFEDAYTTVRSKEQRLLTDEQVLHLPQSETNSEEWRKRVWTLDYFERHMREKNVGALLDIGCGNGWFTARMTKYAKNVVGLDVGKLELEQAARCFDKEGLQFICCTDWQKIPEQSFDCITFNGSAHYFELTPQFWESLYRILRPGGEIHLLDSPIYSSKESRAAKERSVAYFNKMGVPLAAKFYKHITWDDLPKNAETNYAPNRFLNKLVKTRSPFPWVTIYKPA